MLEQLEDIVEELADNLGIYGTHTEHDDDCECRVCFSCDLSERIRRAIEIENRLNTPAQAKPAGEAENVG